MECYMIQNDALLETLKDSFGFDRFREGQQEIIEAILSGNDCVGILPTGAGKSLCFQLPAVTRDGLTLVVSPLIALMKDQVDTLTELGIAATYINSSVGRGEMQRRLRAMSAGEYRLVYAAPERFRNERFRSALRQVRVALFAVDEAHCISMWGHDFRPDYTRLRGVVEQLGTPQIIALTATATPDVRDDIIDQLGLAAAPRNSPHVVVSGFMRPNLTLAVRRVRNQEEKLARLTEILNEFPTGIVYCATRGGVEKVHSRLAERGVSCVPYHAGMGERARKRSQDLFLGGMIPVAVATNAFGMGIDRADLRTIVHWDIPGSIEAYYQEAGRAGRDGEAARCELLFSHADVRTQEFFIEGANPSLPLVQNTANIARQICGDGAAELTIEKIAARFGPGANEMAINTALGLLEKVGFLHRFVGQEPGTTMASIADPRVDLSARLGYLSEKAERDRRRLRLMLRFAGSRSCRHRAILDYFGDVAAEESCPGCDNCQRNAGHTERPRRALNEEEWLDVQKALSCVARLNRRFGIARVAQVLTGSRSQQILQQNLHEVRTYGAMTGRSQAVVRGLLEALLDAECLEIIGDEYPMLAITTYGRAVMLRQEDVRLALPEKAVPGNTRNPDVVVSKLGEVLDNSLKPALAEALKSWRGETARKRGQPAYVILTNATIDEIARVSPTDRDSLLAVSGIGPARLETYGEEILRIVEESVAKPSAPKE